MDSTLPEIDEQIAIRVQKGDKEAFGLFIERYEKKLSRYGRKFLPREGDIEDIVQDIFISCYQNIQSFDTDQKFSSWIYRIAHNAFINELKKSSRNPLVLVDFDTFIGHPAYDDPAESERENEELKKMIAVGLESISIKYKEILILHYLEDLAYKEIADVLQVPIGTVGIRIKRAKEALREAYQKKNIQYGN